MKRTILRATILTAAVAWASLAAIAPASASISASISGVKQCDTPSCANTTAVKTDGTGIAQGTIQITASVSTNGLLESLKWVRISVRDDSTGAFTCLTQFTASGSSTTKTVTWNTAQIPTLPDAPGCPSGSDTYNRADKYGALTHNGTMQLQVQASSNQQSIYPSGVKAILLNNAPSTPTWASDPSVSGASQSQPVVTLSWNADPEPDVLEYHFVRLNPDNTSTEFAVSAANPSNQGCALSNGVYTCYDSSFASTGFGGSYSYWLVAYRSSPSTADHCSDVSSGANCIQSSLSQQKSVSMSEPTPSPSGSPSSGGGSGSTGSGPGGTNVGPRPTDTGTHVTPTTGAAPTPSVLGRTVTGEQFCFTCGSYNSKLPYGSLPGDGSTAGAPGTAGPGNPILAAGSPLGTGNGGSDPRQLWTSIAAGMVLLLTAAHVARILRATAH